MQNVAAVDLGNAIFQAIVNGVEYNMPNAIAPCEKNEEYFESTNLDLFDKMIVEIDSASLIKNKARYYVGKSAAKSENQITTGSNNQKASEDRTMVLLLSLLAYHFAKERSDHNTVNIDFDLVTTALPTRQVKKDREELKQKIIGHHTVTFKNVPKKDENGVYDVPVKLNIMDGVVGIEGNLAFLALTRDPETLKVKNETLLKETILIADIGGDSYDPAAFESGKLIDDSGIKGASFGINRFLDDIITDVEDDVKRKFTRHELEQLLIKDKSEWYFIANQKRVELYDYVQPHFKVMANGFLNQIDKTRKLQTLQGVQRIYPIGGPVVVAKQFIKEAIVEMGNPFSLELDVENVEKLNLIGLWILAQATMKSKKQMASTVKE